MTEFAYRVTTQSFTRSEDRTAGPYDAAVTAYLDAMAQEGWEPVQLGDWQVGFGSEGRREIVLRRQVSRA